MSENTTSAPDTGTLAPEEIEAAMAANASDEMERLQRELSELKAKSADLADQFLRAKAEAENARRRGRSGQGAQVRHRGFRREPAAGV